MSDEKEREIRFQFLDEAEEYLNTIESVLLNLTPSKINEQIDSSLRAAHSIKGGAAMMRYNILSELAHRLEDFFKVIKAQKQTLNDEVEGLILNTVDYLRQIINYDRQEIEIEKSWLENTVNPVFNQLNEILGEPQTENLVTTDGEGNEQNMIALLFETEVQGCLERLEKILADPQKPYLLEECTILAQELNALGQMLELQSFCSLCESIGEYLEKYPEKIDEIATIALQEWRRSQALVMVGQLENLPVKISLESSEENVIDPSLNFLGGNPEEETNGLGLGLTDLPLDINLDFPLEIPLDLDELIQNDDLFRIEVEGFENVEISPQNIEGMSEIPPGVYSPIFQPKSETKISDRQPNLDEQTVTINREEQNFTRELKPGKKLGESSSDQPENTVRVPLKYLEQLNDLCGELTIQRNSLDLRLTRMLNLVNILNRRVQNLEQSNIRLRESYDQISIPHLTNTSANNNLSGDNNIFANKEFDILELDQYSEWHLVSQEIMETIVQIKEVQTDIQFSLDEASQTARDINQTNKQLQLNLTQVRMRPLADIVGRFPRALRDMSREYGKNVELKIYGDGTLIDRTVLEALNDPLMHLLRNSFDHGIETAEKRAELGKPSQGKIEIRSGYRGNQTIITISDDGKGIDLEKVRDRAIKMGIDPADLDAAGEKELLALIFEPGFSTAEKVTAISGRGVGMDVVRTNLKKVRGDIQVETEKGVGTKFTISVPFTLSVMRVLLVESHGMLLAIPKESIEELLILENAQILKTATQEILNWVDQLVPLVSLNQWLQFNCSRKAINTEVLPIINQDCALLISQGSKLFAVKIDRCWGEQEVAVRQIQGDIKLPVGFAGCTILGDGRVLPLVDIPSLLQWLTNVNEPASNMSKLNITEHTNVDIQSSKDYAPEKNTILIIDDSINVRRFLALSLEKAGYQVEQAKDGQEAVEKLMGGLKVQFVICDIEMPRLDGYGFLSKVKSEQKFKNLPVAMLTSRSGDKHRQLAMNLGASAYFSKPYKEQELIQTIQELMSKQLMRV